MRFHRCRLLTFRVLLLGLLGAFLCALDALLLLVGQLLALLASKRLRVVRLIPLTEWHRIDGDDRALDESLGAHQFVVGSIVDSVDDTRLVGATLKVHFKDDI